MGENPVVAIVVFGGSRAATFVSEVSAVVQLMFVICSLFRRRPRGSRPDFDWSAFCLEHGLVLVLIAGGPRTMFNFKQGGRNGLTTSDAQHLHGMRRARSIQRKVFFFFVFPLAQVNRLFERVQCRR